MYKSVLGTFVLLFSCMLSIAQTDDFLQSEVSYTKLDENPLDRWHIGKVVVPIEYDSVSVSSDGYVKVGKDDRFGIWSCDGKMVYPTECESVAVSDRGRMFRYGAAEGRIDGVHVRIDVFGNVVHQYSLMNMN